MLKEYFLEYFWKVLTEHYADFGGKATRKQFWLFIFWSWVLSAIYSMVMRLILVSTYLFNEEAVTILTIVFFIPLFLFSLALIIPNIAIQCRRFRDVGISPWWILLYLLIPIISVFTTILFLSSGYVNSMKPLHVVLLVLGILAFNFLCGVGVIIINILPSGYFIRNKGNLNIVQK